MAHVDSKYLDFCPQLRRGGRKTIEVDIRARSDEFLLGTIHWFGRWRQYTFSPNRNCTFNKTCLREIADYCEQLNKEHRATATTTGDAGVKH